METDIIHDDKIVMMGMSGIGKTTFAKSIITHQYICFDALFHWHLIETLNLSTLTNLRQIKPDSLKFVIDGWHLGDSDGKLLPKEACVYMIYAPFNVINEKEHMYKRWYRLRFKKMRFFRRDLGFKETSFTSFLEHSR